MFLVGLLSWWYGRGLFRRIEIIKVRLISSADFFSIGLLLSTLFAPYKQISAEEKAEDLPDRFRVFLDKLLSRFIGAFIRTFMIFLGLIVIIAQSLFGLITIILWLFIPISPAICVLIMMSGWVLR